MSADDVIGYLTQCEACGGRVLTVRKHGAGWCCPSCSDFGASVSSPARAAVLGPYAAAGVAGPVKLPAEFDTPTGLAALLRHHGVRVEFVEPATDDEYPIGQVRG